MKKNNKNKSKSITTIDMTSRKNINSDIEKIYTDEEFAEFIADLENQLKQMEQMRQYYSMNACIDRILKRSFWDIFKEKYKTFFKKSQKKKMNLKTVKSLNYK